DEAGGTDGGEEPPWAHSNPPQPGNPNSPSAPDVRGGGSIDGDDEEPPWAHSNPPPDAPPGTPHYPGNADGPKLRDGAGGVAEEVFEGVVLPEGACFTTGQDFFDEVVGDASGYGPDGLVDGI